MPNFFTDINDKYKTYDSNSCWILNHFHNMFAKSLNQTYWTKKKKKKKKKKKERKEKKKHTMLKV